MHFNGFIAVEFHYYNPLINSKEIYIMELTVPFETNIEERNRQKSDKYASLVSDIDTLEPHLTAFEVGSRGYITPENKTRLRKIYKLSKTSISFKSFLMDISNLAISSSYYLFLSRNNPSWENPPLLNISKKP